MAGVRGVTVNEHPSGPRATRRRDKLSPDPAVRRTILAAAVEITREDGVRGLGIAGVLERCGLGTRAFYRHFASKDELLEALFVEIARAETRRLQRRMQAASGPVDAVAAWIDGRLDLAFDQNIKSDLRQLSEEAQSLMFSSPRLVQAAFGELLKPLIEQLERGLAERVFDDIDPPTDAQMIQGAVWACTERQWATGETVRADIRTRALRSCLRGLGVAPETVTAVLAARAG